MRRFRDFYGGQPLHLLASIACFALIVAGFAGWLAPGSDPRGILTWLLGCLVAFELVLAPFAWLLDRIAFGAGGRRRHGAVVPLGGGRAYVRVPALLSGLLLLVFAPLIFRLGSATFSASTGYIPTGYLYRWLFATAGLFAASALLYAVSLARARRLRSAETELT